MQEQNAAMTRVQGDMQLEQQKHANDLENIDAKGSAQAGVAVIRSVLKGHEAGELSKLQEMSNPMADQTGTGSISGQ
jgi:hypothetical protein